MAAVIIANWRRDHEFVIIDTANPNTLTLPLTLNTNDARHSDWPPIDKLAEIVNIIELNIQIFYVRSCVGNTAVVPCF